MAGSVIISSGNVWTIGLHGFTPIIERIRAAYVPTLAGEDATIFSSMEEGFDFIGLENLSQRSFMDFVHKAEKQLSRFSEEGTDDKDWQAGLVAGWRDLLDQLRQDPRYKHESESH